MPGSTPATSQLDWLISTTAMIVLSWSNATRDLIKACPGAGRGRSAGASGHSVSYLPATMVPSPSPPAPYHLSAGGRWIRTVGTRQKKQLFMGCPRSIPQFAFRNRNRAPSQQGPIVRIHLLPGESHVRTRRSPTRYVKPRDRVSSPAPGGRSCISPRDSRAERIILTGGQDRSRLHAWDDRHRAKAGLIHLSVDMSSRLSVRSIRK